MRLRVRSKHGAAAAHAAAHGPAPLQVPHLRPPLRGLRLAPEAREASVVNVLHGGRTVTSGNRVVGLVFEK